LAKIADKAAIDAYKLQDDGYADIRWIYHRRKKIGHVAKTAADEYFAKIGNLTVEHQASWDEAFNAVLASYLGISIQEIARHAISGKGEFQIQTEAIIDFLKTNTKNNSGKLHFTNDNLAALVGGINYKRVLGNLISRLDFACYLAQLPPLGCAAVAPFPKAWMDREGRDWRFPRDAMCIAAQSRRWSEEDFEKVRGETRALNSGRARNLWDDELATHEGKIKDWAFGAASRLDIS
jgi:hypothetical protein